jgi:hypothetical protein
VIVEAPPELIDDDVRLRRLREPLLAELARPARSARRLPARAVAVAALALALLVTVGGRAARSLTGAGHRARRRLARAPDRGQLRRRGGAHADAPGTPRALKPGSGEFVRLSRVRYERDTLRIPVQEVRESTGYFIFYAGRAARPGEEPLSAPLRETQRRRRRVRRRQFYGCCPTPQNTCTASPRFLNPNPACQNSFGSPGALATLLCALPGGRKHVPGPAP